MSKLSAVDGQLQQHCEECKQSGTHKVIGKLNFCTNCSLYRVNWTPRRVLKTYGGNVFRGKFEGTVVAVKRLHKHIISDGIVTAVESETLCRFDVHSNIVQYYATEQDEVCWFVNLNYDEE